MSPAHRAPWTILNNPHSLVPAIALLSSLPLSSDHLFLSRLVSALNTFSSVIPRHHHPPTPHPVRIAQLSLLFSFVPLPPDLSLLRALLGICINTLRIVCRTCPHHFVDIRNSLAPCVTSQTTCTWAHCAPPSIVGSIGRLG